MKYIFIYFYVYIFIYVNFKDLSVSPFIMILFICAHFRPSKIIRAIVNICFLFLSIFYFCFICRIDKIFVCRLMMLEMLQSTMYIPSANTCLFIHKNSLIKLMNFVYTHYMNIINHKSNLCIFILFLILLCFGIYFY